MILACPKNHAGGMAASGLSTTDAVRREIFGGLVRELIDGVVAEYRRTIGEGSPDWKLIQDGWYYEPSVAERVFDRMLESEAERLEFRRGQFLRHRNRRKLRVMQDLVGICVADPAQDVGIGKRALQGVISRAQRGGEGGEPGIEGLQTAGAQ